MHGDLKCKAIAIGARQTQDEPFHGSYTHSQLHSHLSILSQLLQKVDIDLRTAVECVNNLQLLMNSCQGVSNNDTYNVIYQKAADMVSPEEISMSRTVKHQTMRSNVPVKSPKNYYLLNLYYPFLDSVIL